MNTKHVLFGLVMLTGIIITVSVHADVIPGGGGGWGRPARPWRRPPPESLPDRVIPQDRDRDKTPAKPEERPTEPTPKAPETSSLALWFLMGSILGAVGMSLLLWNRSVPTNTTTPHHS